MTNQNLDDKIKELALQGLFPAEISHNLDLDIDYIKNYINHLNAKKRHEIQTAQENRKNQEYQEVVTDILKIAEEVKKGLTFFEIGLKRNKSEQEIKDFLKRLTRTKTYQNKLLSDFLNDQNQKNEEDIKSLYERLEAYPNRIPDKFKNNTTYNNYMQYKNVIKMLQIGKEVQFQITYIELGLRCDLSKNILREVINQQKYVDLAKEILGEELFIEMPNLMKEYNEQNLKENSSLFFEKKLSQEEYDQLAKIRQSIGLWYKILFTYELTIEELANILEFPNVSALDKEFRINLANFPKEYANAFHYHLEQAEHHRKDNTPIVKEFLQARRYQMSSPYKEKYINFLKDLNDLEVLELLNPKQGPKKEIKDYTSKDWERIVSFRIKYALTLESLKIDPHVYQNHIPENLKIENARLNEYNVMKIHNIRRTEKRKER